MTSFTTHSAGQVIASADINLIQTAVNTLEANAPRKAWASEVVSTPAAVAFAWKGNTFAPTNTITVYGITYVANALPSSAVVQGAITTHGATVSTISLTSAFTNGTTFSGNAGSLYLEFASPVTLTGGTTYGIWAGYNAGAGVTATTSLPIWATPGTMFSKHWFAPPGTLTVPSTLSMNTLAPVVGTTVGASAQTAGAVYTLGLVWA